MITINKNFIAFWKKILVR